MPPFSILDSHATADSMLEGINNAESFMQIHLVNISACLINGRNWETEVELPFATVRQMTRQSMGVYRVSAGAEGLHACSALENRIREALERCQREMESWGVPVPDKVTIAWGFQKESEHWPNQKGCAGFGGIPGFITLSLEPRVFDRVEGLVAHEFAHNVRFLQFPSFGIPPAGRWVLEEGIAEAFVEHLYPDQRLMSRDCPEPSKDRVRQILENDPDIDERTDLQLAWQILQGDGDFPGYAVAYELVQKHLALQDLPVEHLFRAGAPLRLHDLANVPGNKCSMADRS